MGAVLFKPSKALAEWMKNEEWPASLPVRPCIGDIVYSNTHHENGRAMARVEVVLFKDQRMIAVLGPRLEDVEAAKKEYAELFEKKP
jgi:hypothetical protein